MDHCLAAAPAEACGLIAVSGSTVTAVYPTGNDSSSLDAFIVPPGEHFRSLQHAEGHGWDLGGSFHSHPRGEAVPSARDIEAALDPDWAYLVVSLVKTPTIRGWRIRSGKVAEIRLA